MRFSFNHSVQTAHAELPTEPDQGLSGIERAFWVAESAWVQQVRAFKPRCSSCANTCRTWWMSTNTPPWLTGNWVRKMRSISEARQHLATQSQTERTCLFLDVWMGLFQNDASLENKMPTEEIDARGYFPLSTGVNIRVNVAWDLVSSFDFRILVAYSLGHKGPVQTDLIWAFQSPQRQAWTPPGDPIFDHI